MVNSLVRLRRIVALSVAIALLAAPIASAQTPEAAPPGPVPSNTALLSPAAFARLMQPPAADVGPVPATADSRNPSLLRQGTMAMARQAQAAPAKAPQQKSWVSRHKVALGWTIAGSLLGALFLGVWWSCHGDEC